MDITSHGRRSRGVFPARPLLRGDDNLSVDPSERDPPGPVRRRLCGRPPPHIPREGSGRGADIAAGEGGGNVQIQDQFMVVQLVGFGLSISVEVYRGNLNDPPQYADFIPQLMFL